MKSLSKIYLDKNIVFFVNVLQHYKVGDQTVLEIRA